MTTGWKLDPDDRARLLTLIPPRWPVVVADHVTLHSGEADLPAPAAIAIVGEADDGAGVQALVVTVDGTTERPDSGTYHITWSLERGRKAVESNAVIARCGWRRFPQCRPVTAAPARWDWVDA